MNKEWADKNKEIQTLLAKEATFEEAIKKLIEFRGELFQQITWIVEGYPEEAFYQMPFAGAAGYHSKTLAYSIWHIFRIEDIVAHEMIAGDEQILFHEGFLGKTASPIITTGNELKGEEIAEFSKKLDVKELYLYAKAVKEATDQILLQLQYKDLKKKFTDETKQKLIDGKCVSEDENAFWLIDYWCGKDIKGLIQMPFSRHWIMHIEAMLRIKDRLCKLARKGADPVAICGLSCSHCFLGAWCGGCRTVYNTCSCAICSEGRICPNVKCCNEKNIDGCYECNELETCEKGFYVPTNDGANAAKAQSLYIRKYGKKAFLKIQTKLHEKYEFQKVQEILGQDYKEALRMLEENEAFAFLSVDDLRDDEIFLKVNHLTEAQPERKFVPAYHFDICLLDGTVIGGCDLRIGHSDKLYIGGNIGYHIDEPYRGHHYAAKACRLMFLQARKHRLTYLIITCLPTNKASSRTCELAGGRYLETVAIPEDNEMYAEGKREVMIYRFELE